MNNVLIEHITAVSTQQTSESKPLIFDFNNHDHVSQVIQIFKGGNIKRVTDDYKEQQREFFAAKNPQVYYSSDFENEFSEYFIKLQKKIPIYQQGKWVYYPWLYTLVHILDEEAFHFVRTSRNQNLITHDEQEHFYHSTIGVAGLSVGNSVALAIVLQGGAQHIKIADHDQLALSNLNRIRVGIESLGIPKTIMTAREMYSINPYAIVETFSEGLTEETIDDFFRGTKKLDIVIDEIDNLAIKYLIRKHASKYKLPVIMAADVADNSVVYVERYDENPNLDFFHGYMGDVSYDELLTLDKFNTGKKIAQQVGLENHTEAMLASLAEMGKSIVSWPQLGGAALLNGSVVAYCARKIANKQPIQEGRIHISLDEKLIPGYGSEEEKKKRALVINEFKKILKL